MNVERANPGAQAAEGAAGGRQRRGKRSILLDGLGIKRRSAIANYNSLVLGLDPNRILWHGEEITLRWLLEWIRILELG